MARPSALIGSTAPSVEVAPGTDPAELLRPYVPRLVIDWLRTTPDAVHREVEGSLVFVDISGFPALSERLGKKGKAGAELMRDTLDGVFTALLDEVHASTKVPPARASYTDGVDARHLVLRFVTTFSEA